MNDLLIFNARVVTPTAVLYPAALGIEGGTIVEIVGPDESPQLTYSNRLDAGGNFLLPGIIDIHTDAIEKEIHPRPGANFPLAVAFRELERRMSGCGITTVYHSLYLGYYAAEVHDEFDRRELFLQLHRLCQQPTIIDNRIHLRFEVTGIDEYQTCLDLIEAGCVQLLSFMDHTPGQGQYGLDKYSAFLRKEGLSEEEIAARCAASLAQPRLSAAQMQTISYVCQQYGIPIASHDDDNPDKVVQMQQLGASICEFPINEAAARQALQLNMPTVGGASNVLRGGSLSGNLNVQEAIAAGLITTLCSDYYPPAILHAVFKLFREGVLSLPAATALATLHPAEAAGIAPAKGCLEVGKSADCLLIALHEDVPVVTHTFWQGQLVAQANLHRANALA